MKQKIILVFLLILSQIGISFGGYTQTDLKLFYDKLYNKIEIQSKNDSKKINSTLEKIDLVLGDNLIKVKNKKNKDILSYLSILNKNQLTKNILKEKNSKTQVINDINVKNNLNHPTYVNYLTQNGYNFINISDKLEFIENNKNYRLKFKKYYELDNSNYNYFSKNKLNNSIIVFYEGKYIITNDFIKEEKYLNNSLEKKFTNFINLDNPYILENGIYYSYKYTNYIYFENSNGLYESDLNGNSINLKTTLLIKNKDNYQFSNNYQKVKLVSENTIKNITNKNEFLSNILDDNKFIVGDYDNLLKEIKNETQNLIYGLNTPEEKIKKIYDYNINRISYYYNYANGNKEVFSGVLTYKNKTGVCDGYVKLFLYMLSFAQIENVEIKRGFAYDSSDFPNYGHAWVKIGNYYYDPTFDDTIKLDDEILYYYFKLPKEVLYTNRFDGINIPKSLKNTSLEDRKKIVLKNMYDIYEKNKHYLLLNKVKNRLYLDVNFDKKITLEIIEKKMGLSEVNAGSFSYNGYKFSIKSLNYYTINNNNIESIIGNSLIDLEDEVYFLKWFKEDGTFEYRLAYNIIFY